MQAICALADSQPALLGTLPGHCVKHTQRSAEPDAQPAIAPVSCQSIVWAMARSACSAADQRQEAALKRKASLVGRSPGGPPLRCWPAASPAKAYLFSMLTAEHLYISVSSRGSGVQALRCMQGGLDERELRKLIQSASRGCWSQPRQRAVLPLRLLWRMPGRHWLPWRQSGKSLQPKRRQACQNVRLPGCSYQG